MNIIERPYYFADAAHGNQKYGRYTYMFHLWSAVREAQDLGLREELVAACMLHDVLEDTTTTYNDVKTEFGESIADIVYCVTDELGKNRKERHARTYPKIIRSRDAMLAKICDRIANVRYSKAHDAHKFKMYRKENDNFIGFMTRSKYYNTAVSHALTVLNGLFE